VVRDALDHTPRRMCCVPALVLDAMLHTPSTDNNVNPAPPYGCHDRRRSQVGPRQDDGGLLLGERGGGGGIGMSGGGAAAAAAVTYERLQSDDIEAQWADRCRGLCEVLNCATCYLFGGRSVVEADFQVRVFSFN
jgi:hypothetical protein